MESSAPVLGIDIGGTKVAYAVGDREGGVRARSRRPTEASGSPEQDLLRMAEDARALVVETGLSLADLDGVGVSVPGPFDPKRGVLINPPNLPGWGEVPVAELLSRELGVRVSLENDANAAALAEWRFGAARGYEHVIYLTMSTGVGAGLVLGGRIHRGLNASAGEVGHMLVERDGALCGCGQRGCLEAYVGGAGWGRHLREVTPDASRVALLAGGRDRVRPEHLVAAAKEGDAFALAEFERFNDYLARGIAQVLFLLAPEAIVLGTIAVAAGEDLCFGPLRERLRSLTWPVFTEGLEILPAALGEDLPYLAGICAAL